VADKRKHPQPLQRRIAVERAKRFARFTPLARRGWATILLPKHVGRSKLANVEVGEDGVMDTSGKGRLPRWLRWTAALSLAKEPYTQLMWISDTGNLDLYDPEARAGVWGERLELLARPDHRMSFYFRVRPFPVDELVRASGPVGADVLEWAKTLVRRRLILAVSAGRRRILARRMVTLLGVGDDEGGKLSRAGLYGQPLTEEEVDDLCSEAWGVDFSPALSLTPRSLEVQTGDSDPLPIGYSPDQPEPSNPGVRRHRTYAITGTPSRVFVGWLQPLTGRRLQIDLGLHVTPIHDSWAEMVLGLKRAWWGGLPFGRDKYADPHAQAGRTLNLMRRRETSVLKVGMYLTVAETQAPVAEEALKETVGKRNYLTPAFEPLAARMATEPTGRDPLNKTWWTDSQTIAAAWPGSGGIWVPGCTLIGESVRSNEPVGMNLWWGGDEAPILFLAGRSGSGKTNLTMGLCGRNLEPHPDHWLAAHPPQLVVSYVKPWDEWAAFCKRYGGKHYSPTDSTWEGCLRDAPMDAPVVAWNMRGISAENRPTFLNELEPWVAEHQLRYRRARKPMPPFMYAIGEAWAMSPGHLQQLALQDARALRMGLLVDTQYIDAMMKSDARDIVRSCSGFALMRLRTSEREDLGKVFDIGPEGMHFLAQIAQINSLTGGIAAIKGQCIFEAHGLRTTMRVKRFGFEVGLLNQTDPMLASYDEVLDAVDVQPEVTDNEPSLITAGKGVRL
jgi:hypothetical protein